MQVACQHFRNHQAALLKIIDAIEVDGSLCGVPPQLSEQVKIGHTQSMKVGEQVCAAAALGSDKSQLKTGDFWTADEIKRYFPRP